MTPLVLIPVEYAALNARQKENYNYQKIAGVLAEYGFVTHRLSDDWNGADFIAQHLDGIRFLKVQLKPRLCFQKKYLKQDIYIAFPVPGGWYLYPHDALFDVLSQQTNIPKTDSWATGGAYSFPKLSASIRQTLAPYFIPDDAKA